MTRHQSRRRFERQWIVGHLYLDTAARLGAHVSNCAQRKENVMFFAFFEAMFGIRALVCDGDRCGTLRTDHERLLNFPPSLRNCSSGIAAFLIEFRSSDTPISNKSCAWLNSAKSYQVVSISMNSAANPDGAALPCERSRISETEKLASTAANSAVVQGFRSQISTPTNTMARARLK